MVMEFASNYLLLKQCPSKYIVRAAVGMSVSWSVGAITTGRTAGSKGALIYIFDWYHQTVFYTDHSNLSPTIRVWETVFIISNDRCKSLC